MIPLFDLNFDLNFDLYFDFVTQNFFSISIYIFIPKLYVQFSSASSYFSQPIAPNFQFQILGGIW